VERNVYLKLMTLEQARTLWLERLSGHGPGTEEVPVSQARGRTLAEPALALLSSPAFHGAAMDGIAVLASDTFGASEHKPKTLHIGENAHWVNTGRPLPPGTNAVIMVEHVVRHGENAVIIEKSAFPWQHVRKLGEDMVSTEILLPPGALIGAYEIGALAAAGVFRPRVFVKPRVVIMPTGSELVSLAEASHALLASGEKLPEFNSLTLSALVEDAGGEPCVLPITPDDPKEIRQTLLHAANSDCDLLVINAGSSAGSHDFTAAIIQEIGELWVHGVTIMPGKPTILGCIRAHTGKTMPVIGVPGYPVSAIIAFEAFGQPLLAQWQDRRMPERAQSLALPYQALPSRPGMEEYIRVKLGQVDDELVAVPLPRGAGTVTSLSRADGIIRIPADVEGLPADIPTPVTLIRAKEHIAGALLAIGSHDNTLDLLDSLLRKENARFSLTSAHVGSLGGIMALQKGRCHLAGSHLLDPAAGIYNQASIREHLPGMPLKLVRLVDREQGFIVPAGNPEKIQGLPDLVRPGITFINRQRGSGTRVLLDWRLTRLNMSPDNIAGYENEEYTHMNVAAAVLSGRASTGLGVKSAAVALGLDFIPLGVEEYDLVIPSRHWDDPRILALLRVIRSDAFLRAAADMGGYGTEKTGQVVWEQE
jgi:putative molybdopterin biosynthesis protein